MGRKVRDGKGLHSQQCVDCIHKRFDSGKMALHMLHSVEVRPLLLPVIGTLSLVSFALTKPSNSFPVKQEEWCY